jgi:ectoine hydroxylase-related dioxygenase (phytanoyl-CoA dioxygenase family)
VTAAKTRVDLGRVRQDLADHGFSVVTDVLSATEVADALRRLWDASAEASRRGMRSLPGLDPNDRNVRVYDLVALDPFFGELLEHPVAHAIVAQTLGDAYIVSNFTANIARPGSGSMLIHSDQSFVTPEPWPEPWTMNIIWCLSDIRGDNGATCFVPGSHQAVTRADLPSDLRHRLVPFEAPAGSIVAMEGRLWHTSGANVTEDEDRPLLFAYYGKPFVRPQWNFSTSLPRATKERFSPEMRTRLGLDPWLNVGADVAP